MTVNLSLVKIWDGWQPRVPDNIVFELDTGNNRLELEASIIELAKIWQHINQKNKMDDFRFGTGGSLSLQFSDSTIHMSLDNKTYIPMEYDEFYSEYNDLLESVFTQLNRIDSQSKGSSVRQQHQVINDAYSYIIK